MDAFDPGDPGFLADPYPTFAALRALAPVHEHPLLGIPVAVSHAACSEVLRGRDLGRIWVDAEPAADFPAFNLLHRNSLLEREGPPHDRLRTLVAGAFNRGHTARLRPWVHELAGRLVGALAGRIRDDGHADLIAGVAAPLPVEVIAQLLDVPEPARSALRGWSNTIVTMYEPAAADPQRQRLREAAAERAAAEFVTALRELATYRRSHPGDDLVTDLLAADVEPDELVGTAALLLMAGHEATVNVIGNGVLALLAHPEQCRRWRADPGLDERCVEELIRFDPPLQLFERAPPSWTPRWPATRSRPARGSPRCSGPRPGIRRPSTTRTSWTWAARATRTWVSGPACTTAWAPRWPGWRSPPPCTPCAPGCPRSPWPDPPSGARTS